MNSPILESKQRNVDNSYGITTGLFLNNNMLKNTDLNVGINVIDNQSNSKTISMTCNTENAIIRYTLDSTDPTEESTEYINEIEVEAPITIKARGYKEGWIDSDVSTLIFNQIKLETPVLEYQNDSKGNLFIVLKNVDSYPDEAIVDYNQYGSSGGSKQVTISSIKNALIKGAITVVTLTGIFVVIVSCDGYVDSDMSPLASAEKLATPVVSQDGNNITITGGTAGASIYYSTDGSNPTIASNLYGGVFAISEDCTIKAISIGDGYIPSAVANYEAVYTPPFVAPTNWTAISDMKFGTSSIKSVCYGNGKFVAVGNSGKGAYSTDGVNWAAISDMTFSTRSVNSACYGNGKFVAVGASGKGAYSTDGINWTAISDMTFGTSSMTSSIKSVCYGNGKFVAVGYGINGKGAYSTDGITWTAISDMTFSNEANSVCYGNDKFVAVGSSGQGAYSIDGINWTAISDMKFGSTDIYSVCYGDGKFVAVGDDGKASYSTDGINWTAIDDMTFGTSQINSVCYENGEFIAVGNSGKGSYCIA